MRHETHSIQYLDHLLNAKVFIRNHRISRLLLFLLIRSIQLLPQYDLLLYQAEVPLESLPYKLLALLIVIRFGLGEIADFVKLLLCPLLLLPSLVGIVIEDLLQVFTFLGTAATLKDLRSLGAEFLHLHVPLHLLLIKDLFVQIVETFMNRLGISCFSKLTLDNFAGTVVDHWVHGRVF